MWRQAAIWSFDCSSQKIRMLYSSMTALVHVSKLFAEVQEYLMWILLELCHSYHGWFPRRPMLAFFTVRHYETVATPT